MSRAVARYKDDFVDIVIDWDAVILIEKRPLVVNIYFKTPGLMFTLQAMNEKINSERYEMLYAQFEQIIWGNV